MLVDLCTQKGNISFLACAAQMCFVLMLGGVEFFLLTVMAYDHYVATLRNKDVIVALRKLLAKLLA
jgi:hypothetical protein